MRIRPKAWSLCFPVTLLLLARPAALLGFLWWSRTRCRERADPSGWYIPHDVFGWNAIIIETIVVLIGVWLGVELIWAWHANRSRAGVSVDRAQAPALWRCVDDLSDGQVHRIRIGETPRTCVSSRRRWLVGPVQNTLLLGLPLLRTMTL
ncbi:MAG: hypothetical protein ACKPEA_19550 [Planctomycetota bacterium]